MTTSTKQEEFGRDPKLWMVCAMKWVLENPESRYEILGGFEIEKPADEAETTSEIESAEVADFERAVAAAHELLDKHAREAADIGFEIYLMPPMHPYPDQEQLGVRSYRLSAKARKLARAVGIRGGDLEARGARMVRYAVPFDHKTANLRFRGIIMRLEDDTVTWIGLAVPPRRRRKTK